MVLEASVAEASRAASDADDASVDRRAVRASRREAKLASRRQRATAKQAAADARARARALAAAAKAAEKVDSATAGSTAPEVRETTEVHGGPEMVDEPAEMPVDESVDVTADVADAPAAQQDEPSVTDPAGGPAVLPDEHPSTHDDEIRSDEPALVEQPVHEEQAEDVVADEKPRPSELEAPLAHALARAAQFEREREAELETARQAAAELAEQQARDEAAKPARQDRSQAKALRRSAKEAQRPAKVPRRPAKDDHIVEPPREPKVPLRDRLVKRRAAGDDPPAAAAATSRGSRVVSALAGLVGAIGLICSVLLAFGALLVALDATSSGVYDTVSSVCDVLVGPARDIVSFSGTNAAMKEALVAWGAGAIVYLVVGIAAQTVLRSRIGD